MKKVLSILLSAVLLFGSLSVFGMQTLAEDQTDLSAAEVKLSATEYTYNGQPKEPKVKSVVLTLEGIATKLIAGTDYTVSYQNNIDAGTASVLIEGIGAYTGEIVRDFTINSRSITKGVKFASLTKLYPRSEPAYTVTYGDSELAQDIDYTISVKGNQYTGINKATVTIKGIGNFKGSKTFKRNVVPFKVKNLKFRNVKTDSYRLIWKSQKDIKVSGYRVYSCDKKGNNTKLVAEVKDNSTDIGQLDSGKAQYYTVRAFKQSGGEYAFGDYSSVLCACTKPEAVSLKSVAKSADKKKLVVRWTPVACSRYVIEYTTDKKFKKHIKSVTVKKSSAAVKKIKIKENDKKYYARIKAVKSYNSGKSTKSGKWSPKLSSEFSVVYATFSTHYPWDPNRINNLRVASKYINGTVLSPGETFSFDGVVGRRTSGRGFKPANVFVGAHDHALGVGGGVCQVASTIFNAALLANLPINMRYQHSQRVTYVVPGRDAAISWGSKNFKFTNNTKYPIKMKMSVANYTITCTLLVSADVKPKKVKLSVSRSGNTFTLKRYVGGKCNYTTRSTY